MLMHDYNREDTKVVLPLHPMPASGEMMYHLLSVPGSGQNFLKLLFQKSPGRVFHTLPGFLFR